MLVNTSRSSEESTYVLSPQHKVVLALRKRLASLLFGSDHQCRWCNVQVEFTGFPPANDYEKLLLKLAGNHKQVSFHWLEERLAEALYREELRQGAWVGDIGVLGPAGFRNEAYQKLIKMKPEFGLLKIDNEDLQCNAENPTGDFVKEDEV